MGDTHSFQGQVALVTGGGEGIGRTIAMALVRQQAGVAICGRRVEELEGTADDLVQAGGDVLSIPCDVTRRVDVEHTMKRVIQKFGRLDILVNNAGASGQTSIHDPDDSKWQNILQVNLTGSYLVSKLAIPHMLPHHYGRIVNISSVLGRFGVAGYLAYCTAKHGILGFTKALALEVASQGITVNAICPTWVDTAMARKGIEETAASLGVSPDEFRESAISMIPIKRMAEAEEVASLVLYLCSHAASAITGQALNVCGGTTAGTV
ncbi:MAG: SDR family oxidoreductase [Nitrospiraceae bacterium]|nr:SDR family oxidoreductase [Nitrospira sp.]MCB9773230.1 SDR family oxidoreductase [Nitrospiraceae bacterium]